MKNIFNRKYYLEKIRANLSDKKKILFITWARQVGKTTLLESLFEFGYINATQTIQIQWDNIIDAFYSGADFLSWIQLTNNLQEKKYLIIDEAQAITNIWKILKNLIDLVRTWALDLKIIVSGSWTLSVFRWMTDSLIWRKTEIVVNSFSFEEFCAIKWLNVQSITGYNDAIDQTISPYFEEYIRFWWYPEVVLEPDYEKKAVILSNLINDYIQKDISILLREQEIINIKKSLKLLSKKVCNTTSLSEISQEVGISRYVAEKYLSVLENTFLLSNVEPFVWWNISKEVKTKQKIYFNDIWVMRFFLDIKDLDKQNRGALIENFVFNELKYQKTQLEKIKFWQRLNTSEVDFILHNDFDNTILPIEVKSGGKWNISKSYSNFLEYYKDNIRLWVVTTQSYKATRDVNWKTILFTPYVLVGKEIKNLRK